MLRAVVAATCALASVGAVATTAQATSGDSGRPDIDRVVTFGDSHSSGSGIHRHASSYDDHGPMAHWFDRTTRPGSSAARLRTAAGIRYVSVVDEFDGHGACRVWQRDRYVNDLVFGDTVRRRRLGDGTIRSPGPTVPSPCRLPRSTRTRAATTPPWQRSAAASSRNALELGPLDVPACSPGQW